MSMQAASLEVLEKANVPAPQARAIVQAIEIELSASQSTLATKHDLEELGRVTKHDLEELGRVTKQDLEELGRVTKQDLEELGRVTKQDLEELGRVTKQDLEELRRVTKHDLETLAKTTKQDLSDTRHGLELKIEGLRTDHAALRGELGKTAEALQAKIEKSASDIVWRFLTVIVAQTSVMLTVVYFVLTHFRP